MDSFGGWRVSAAALLLLLGLGASACGAEDGDAGAADEPTPTATSSSTDPDPSDETDGGSVPKNAPACAGVWREGTTLPRVYAGCVADGGVYMRSDRLSCSSGQRMVRYDNRFYAVPGGTVHQARPTLAEDRDYRDALASCRA